jgi:D-xylose transport system substrate-binding protein
VNLLRNSKLGIVSCVLAVSVGVAMSSAGASAKSRLVSGHAASINANSFTNTFAALKALKPIAAKGKGKIAAILPDTTSSTRYTEFDEPDLKKAAAAAGLSSDIIVQNGNGSDTTFYSDAQADITNGATVLLIDPEDSGTGVKVENYAKQHGVAVIDYDRLDLGGPADPYVSFNNVNVGRLIGKGFEACVKAWHVGHPNVIMMRGAPTDNNATLFWDGYYNDVLAAKFKSGAYTDLVNTAGTWNPTSPAPDALQEFETAYTGNPTANSAVIPNDENGAPIITYLKSQGVKPKTFPTTGQDATLIGLQNIISGYQCGTVYKAVYKEAGAAVALAIYLRDRKQAPAGLENGVVTDPTNHKKVRSVLLPPVWVTTKNMKSTIIKDNFVTAKQLCAGAFKADCKKYGI